MYDTFLHGIEEVTTDTVTDRVANLDRTAAQPGDALPRDTRVSLTIRHVPKVLKARLLFGKR